ncbi:hypothetical protein BARRETLEMON_12 [Arthrobacter phage BarretLemon]|uniref:Uncharacterized protein n=3 Tax=Marthavirus barretlemon TaxID=2560300 RepID=A0A386KPQ6_9CAUD|nr:tail completion or Neck1 protein [Arthrobacter phage BarretLemon]AMM44474.1 hypothetical protein BARRETLEMON_12 [Arthrobacter phage BarretLemon]ASR78042.1 hypothetical protein SEA_TIMINATOR_12 [Arthrobacter phage Timinator]AYD86483.1 hypothetical protein SEA_LEEROYJ_12 [Arthrobacter phage LeeroyJ]
MTTVRFAGDGFKAFTLKLDRFDQNIGDAEPAFRAMAEFQTTVVNARQFKQQGTPETGGRWAPLSPPYARWKEKRRPGRPILVFDGDLRDSMTKPNTGIYEIWDKGFVVGTALPYATFHQNGTPIMPARPIIGSVRREDVRNFAKILQRWIVEGTT